MKCSSINNVVYRKKTGGRKPEEEKRVKRTNAEQNEGAARAKTKGCGGEREAVGEL